MNYPANQIDFEMMFETEEQCLEYIIKIKWPDGFICSNCGNNSYWSSTRQYVKNVKWRLHL